MSANEKLIISVDSETSTAEKKLKTAVRRMSRQQVNLDTKNAQRNVQELGKSLAATASPRTAAAVQGLQKLIGGLGASAMTAVVGVAALTAAAIAGGKAFLDYGRSVSAGYLRTQQLAAQAGLLTGEFEAIQFAAKASGQDVSTLTRAIFDLNKRTSEAAKGNKTYGDALKALNIDVAELNNLTSKQRFDRVVAELSKVSNQADKAQIAYNLFGRAGRQLLPVLEDGKNGLAALTREGQRYIVTNQEQIDLARDFTAEQERLEAQNAILTDAVGKQAAEASAKASTAWGEAKNALTLFGLEVARVADQITSGKGIGQIEFGTAFTDAGLAASVASSIADANERFSEFVDTVRSAKTPIAAAAAEQQALNTVLEFAGRLRKAGFGEEAAAVYREMSGQIRGAREAAESSIRTTQKQADADRERRRQVSELAKELERLNEESRLRDDALAGGLPTEDEAERGVRIGKKREDLSRKLKALNAKDEVERLQFEDKVARARLQAARAIAQEEKKTEEAQRKREAESKKQASQQKREQEKIDRDREQREKKLADLRKQVEKQTAAEREQNEKNLANIRRDIGRSIGRDLSAGTGPTFTGGSLTQATGGGRASVTIENADIKRSAKYLDEIQRHTDAMTKLQEEANEKLNDIGRLG